MKFILDKDKLTIDEKESLNSGSIKYYEIPVEYDETWEDLSIAAIIIKEHAEKGIATAVINHNVYVDKTTYGKYFIGFIGYIVEYSLTTDVAIDENKTYYTRSGDEGSYIYTKVDEPSVESISTYYEAEKTYQVTTKLTPVTFKQGAAEIEVENETNIPSLSEWEVYVSQIEDLIDDANDVIDDMNTLITTVTANEETRESNESTRQANELARKSAENTRASAEATRQVFENGRQSAESTRASNETSRQSAESSRASAESSRASAESTRASNESSRQSAESSRVSAESSRVSAESSRVSAENSRASAENTRVSNENSRKSAENTRASNESTRQSNETSRASAETSRVNAETARATAETSRASAETTRASNETTRQSNETTRQSNETTRQSNEAARVAAEEARAEVIEELEAEINRLRANTPTGTTNTNPAYINDSADLPLNKISLKGKTEQYTTTGKQLFNGASQDGTGGGATSAFSNRTITVSSTTTSSIPYAIFNIADNLLENDIVRVEGIVKQSNGRISLQAWNGSTWAVKRSIEYSDGSTVGSLSYTVPSGFSAVRLLVYANKEIPTGNSSSSYDNIIATKNNDNMTYEPYTRSDFQALILLIRKR